MSDAVVAEKVARIRSGARPRTLSLFSGCGGLSLGFDAAGFEISAAVENCPTAAASHGANFWPDEPHHAVARDITSTPACVLVNELGLGEVERSFDVIIGGPPCQAFARVGRSKLREVVDDPEAFRLDGRAELYRDYLEYVDACRPIAALMENVPDVMNFGGRNIAGEVRRELVELGYVSRYTLLNASLYGVPQMRERMFLVAYHRDAAKTVAFPAPTHWIDLPAGYVGTRGVALKLVTADAAAPESNGYVDPPTGSKDLPPAVTVEEALGDLPPLEAPSLVRAGVLRRGPRRFDRLARYDANRQVSDYARSMREWRGFESTKGVLDHVIRYLPRDYPLFARMKEGDQYPEAHELAWEVFEERLAALAREGSQPAPGTEEYERLKSSTIPPYDPDKFPNKWRKIWRDQPARTVMAHLAKDSYSHIHYDSLQARTISVREAARLQSFPDGFVFSGAMNAAFRQIGNAVPPLMAKAIAAEMLNTICGD